MEAKLKSNTAECVVAELAQQAAAIIGDLATCDLVEVHKLFELEAAAAEHVTESLEGALFQLGIIASHVDEILAHVPDNNPVLPRLEAMYVDTRKLLFSISKLLAVKTGDRVRDYYFAANPFELH